MMLPGETEAGTAATNHAEGYPGGLIETMNRGVRARSCAAQPPSDRKTPCLENHRPKRGILTNGESRFSISGWTKATGCRSPVGVRPSGVFGIVFLRLSSG